jgi:DNA-binding transcriptional LysR family regulator
MHQMNRANFDLNLLRVFHAVYATRNVRRSAELLKQSQPAVSHSLTRLRLHLKDPLFIRAPGGVAPTAKADHFAKFVEAALRTIDVALVETARFDPIHSERRFVMHMSDLGEGEFLPELMHHLETHAPHVRVEAMQLAADDVLPAMEQGRIDLAVGYLPQLTGIEHRHLLDDRYAIVTRKGHPLSGRLHTAKGYRQLQYILVNSHAEPAKALHRVGLESRIQLTVPHFGVLPEILVKTDLAAIIPHRPALRFARAFPLEIAEPDLGLAPLRVRLHWTWRMHNDPGHRWLRETMALLYGDTSERRTRRSG